MTKSERYYYYLGMLKGYLTIEHPSELNTIFEQLEKYGVGDIKINDSIKTPTPTPITITTPYYPSNTPDPLNPYKITCSTMASSEPHDIKTTTLC